MGKSSKIESNTTQNKTINESELQGRIEAKLLSRGITGLGNVSEEQLYFATASVIKDIMLEYREDFKRRARGSEAKKVCYLCMEFLVGRSLLTNVMALGAYEALENIYQKYGTGFDNVYSCESDPGLGNGGLGRLAACFMDSLSTMGYMANGYSLLYENGLFKQKIIEGEQIELPDEWLSTGGIWLVAHPEKSVEIKFGGRVEEQYSEGKLNIALYDYESVRAVPYDLLIPGVGANAVNTIRLWRARPILNGVDRLSSQSDYLRNISRASDAEMITKQLYPPDNHDEGKLLRLSQQYLLVSATLQSIISDYLAEVGSLKGFCERIAIHINDTHPAICIPELMRILMDIYSYSWDDAWETVVKTISYTNHTVLPEALECWSVDLFAFKLPRIYSIINEINKRFTADLWNMYPGDWDRISRMSIIAYNQIRMANLSVVGSNRVNGVSALHSDILKRSVFHDFYKLTPWKFINVTNGISHRRWLCYSNPSLTNLICDLCGRSPKTDISALSELMKYKDDTVVLEKLGQIKRDNKARLSDYLNKKCGYPINPDSLFDVQIKRMHEYKRQLLNALKIISVYNDILEDSTKHTIPQTFIFGCKAAPGYVMAKQLIKLIWYLSKEINNNPKTKDLINVFFVDDYNVSVAEKLIPAAEVSEQISLAGKEASGTGCMKLMMNGALTLGTMDGANVEIVEACSNECAYIFGMDSRAVEEEWKNSYNSRKYYQGSERLKRAVDRLYKPIGGQDFSHIGEYLLSSEYGIADPFMCLADFDSYVGTYDRLISDYEKTNDWNRKSLINIATSHIFSSDVSIKKYADEIWKISPVYKRK